MVYGSADTGMQSYPHARRTRAAAGVPELMARLAPGFHAGRFDFISAMTVEHPFVGAVLAVACVSISAHATIQCTFPAAAGALLFHLAHGRLERGGLEHRPAAFSAPLLFFPMFALRGMGAGDVKLLAAVGAWLGPSQVAMAALPRASPAASWVSWSRSVTAT